jgi:hypothetical protein
MEVSPQTSPMIVDVQSSGVSWAAIAAGAVAAAALSLALVAFGAGIGLSVISPWADSGVLATTFKIGSGIYLCIVAVMASSVGGYLAARLRRKRTGFHTNEAFFRDTAHGFLAWAFATLLSAGVLGAATSNILGGAAQGAGMGAMQAGQNVNPADIYVDRLFRADPQAGTAVQPAAGNADAGRAEALRLWIVSFRDNRDIRTDDRTYLARLVSARTGLSQAEADRRVNEVVTDAKAAADRARKAAAQLALWLTASLLLGAFAASLAAVEGGQLRDGVWNERVLTARTI